VQEALTALPCVEASSIKVDVATKEARFTVKDKSTCAMKDITKAIQDTGFTVSDARVKGVPGSPP
jgi:hypothetical protein